VKLRSRVGVGRICIFERWGGLILGSKDSPAGDGLGCPSSDGEYRDRAVQSKHRLLRGDYGFKDTRHQPDETRRSGLKSIHHRTPSTMSTPPRRSVSPAARRNRGSHNSLQHGENA